MVKPVWNNAQRVNHQNFAKKTHPCAKKNLVLRAVLMKSGLVSVNTARQVNTAHSKTTVNAARPISYHFKITHSTVKRPIHKNTTFKNSNINQRVNTVKDKKFNTAKPKAVVNAGNPQIDLQDQGVIDSGCSRHMTGNMSYLTDYEEIDGGYVTFGGNPKGGKITKKCTIKTGNLDFENVYFVRELKFNLFSVSQMCDKKNSALFNDTECIVLSPNFKLIDESQVLLRVPRKNNMYSIDLKNIVPKGGLTCLFAKATSDESKLWHRRLVNMSYLSNFKKFDGGYVAFAGGAKGGRITRSISACHSSEEIGSSQDYILMPLWKDGLPFDSSSKDTSNDEPQPSNDAGKKDDEGRIDDQERTKNSAQDVNTIRPSINTASTNFNTGNLNINTVSPTVPTTPLESTYVDFFGDESELDLSNIATTYPVPTTPNTRIHKELSLDHVVGDVQFGVQTRRMINKQGFISVIYKGKTHKDLHTCLFAYFLSQEEPKKVIQALKDPSWIEAMQEELLQFKLQQCCTLRGYLMTIRAIGNKIGVQNKKDERACDSIKILLCARWDIISAFCMAKLKKKFMSVNLHDLKIQSFLTKFTRIKGDILLVQVYVDDIIFGSTKKVLCTEFEKLMHKKFQISSMGELTFFLGLQVTQKDDGIFIRDKYLKGQPKLGIWYPKDSPFDLEAYTDSNYASASLDRKFTIGVKNLVFHSKTKHIEIRHHFIRDSNEKKLIQMIKIHTDHNVADLLTKAFDVGRFQYLIASIGMLNP
ncbi:putative ribonuclease H-like domain-containing protein [Tanacetum coccineum]